MRTTQSFMLRLLVDDDEPATLRGVIRSIADADERAFGDAQELIAVLRQMTSMLATDDTTPFNPTSSIEEKHHED